MPILPAADAPPSGSGLAAAPRRSYARPVVPSAFAAVVAAVCLDRLAEGLGGTLQAALVLGTLVGVALVAGRRPSAVRPPRMTWDGIRRSAFAPLVVAVALAAAADIRNWQLTMAEALVTAFGVAAGAHAGDALTRRVASRPRNVIVVGTGTVAQRLSAAFAHDPGRTVVGLVDDGRLSVRPAEDGPSLIGDLADLPRLIVEHRAELVVFSFVGTADAELVRAVAASRAAGAEVAVVSRLFQGLRGACVPRLHGLPVVSAAPSGRSLSSEFAKRATDVALAGALLVLTAPLFLVLAVAVCAESRGGPFYRAARVGRDGRAFRMLKFRKMRKGATGSALTLGDDDRFTRMGRFLAHSKLDELPQLVNVLRGDMSFVGPRPEDARFVATQPDAYRDVLMVRPGITGLSQIRYRREFEHLVGDDFEAYYVSHLLPSKLTIDDYYVTHRSWWMDAQILFWTGRALLRGGELDIDHLTAHLAFRRPIKATAPR